MNRFEICQQIYERTGLPANIEALLKFPCHHVKQWVNGKQIRTESWTAAKTVNGFRITEKICTQCGKTLETRIRKPKRPRRRF